MTIALDDGRTVQVGSDGAVKVWDVHDKLFAETTVDIFLVGIVGWTGVTETEPEFADPYGRRGRGTDRVRHPDFEVKGSVTGRLPRP